MSDDIERFLRQAAQRRHRRTAKPIAQTTPKPPTRLTESRQPVQDVEIVEATEASMVEDAADDMAKHVASTMDTSDVTRRADKLGSRVGGSDNDMETHLHSVFDHRVGKLGDDAVEETTGRPTRVSAAAEIARLLQSSHEIRRAVILSEIFRRPEERW